MNELERSDCNPSRSLSHRLLRKITDGIDLAKATNVPEISSNRLSHLIVSQSRKITSISAKRRYPDRVNTVCRRSLTNLAAITAGIRSLCVELEEWGGGGQ